MSFWVLIRRSLRFHARAHFGVLLGAIIGSAALIGALVVGDSVRQTLIDRALSRLGPTHFALYTPDRLFSASLVNRLSVAPSGGGAELDKARPKHPYVDSGKLYFMALNLPGTVSKPDGSSRANQVNVLGVEMPAWPQMAGWAAIPSTNPPFEEKAYLNEKLARQLGVKTGDEIIVRVRKPTALALDATISPREGQSVGMRLKVGAILTSKMLGDFSLSPGQEPPANLFLLLGLLQEKTGASGSVNLVSVSAGAVRSATDSAKPQPEKPMTDLEAVSSVTAQIAHVWRPEDLGISVRTITPPRDAAAGETGPSFVEIDSSRVFLDPAVSEAASRPNSAVREAPLPPRKQSLTNLPPVDTGSEATDSRFTTQGFGVLTYLANLISSGERSVPYSMVTAAGGPLVPAEMKDNEILVDEWLANDLQVQPGDSVALSYYVVDAGSRLTQRTNSFRVRGIVPLKGIYADRTLMPEFPGLAEAESTRNWDTGFPLVYPIRTRDEAYWRQYRGTPKAFITLRAGQAMWANRFGSLTAIRYEVPPNSSPDNYREVVYRNLLANLDPADLGLRFAPVRDRALKAATQAEDFGQLFLGLSFFVIAAALLLMGLLFQFSLEQRGTETGTLLALGFTPKQVRRLLLGEGAALALAGGVLGAILGLGYARAMLWGLATIWRGAVAEAAIEFHASLGTVAIGIVSATVVAVVTIWLTLRKQARRPAVELLTEQVPASGGKARSRGGRLALVCFVATLGILGWTLARGGTVNPGAFFSAGALLLVGGLGLVSAALAALARQATRVHLSVATLGVRGCARRRKRSLATVALLSCGCFLTLAIAVFRLDANQNASSRSSGTGGFALMGQSTLPVLHDLNTSAGREAFGLGPKDLPACRVVPFRVRDGEDASCLNLNRAQRPRLLGVKPALLSGRFRFTKTADGLDRRKGWRLLTPSSNGAATDEVPAVGDAESIQWSLGKGVGDTLDYTDDNGRTFKVRLVGAIAGSVLQGNLIVDEAAFLKKFPNESGYRFFLIDTPSNSVARVSASLSSALQDVGLELTPTVQRLNAFNTVQNTYLGTFQVLGGLGLLLGSAGLGVVVLRNVFERRGELGLLLAVGFRRRTLHRMVLSEHAALLGLGLAVGLVSAVFAVLPALLTPGPTFPYWSMAFTLGVVLLNGALWTWLATRRALRGDLLEALRNE